MTDRSIRSYREASRYSGVPITSLRDAIARGDFSPPIIGADGRATFDVAALDALRAARGKSITAVTPAATVPFATAPAASGSTSAATAPGVAPSALAWAEAFAARGGVATSVGDEDSDDDSETGGDGADHQPPFWAQASAIPSLPIGHPVVDPTSGRISYQAVSAAPQASMQTLLLQRQVAELQAQLAATQAGWRRERVAAIANSEALQAALAGATPDVVGSVHAGVAQTLSALSDDQLCQDGIANREARAAGLYAADAASRAADPEYGGDDVSRARRRRARRW